MICFNCFYILYVQCTPRRSVISELNFTFWCRNIVELMPPKSFRSSVVIWQASFEFKNSDESLLDCEWFGINLLYVKHNFLFQFFFLLKMSLETFLDFLQQLSDEPGNCSDCYRHYSLFWGRNKATYFRYYDFVLVFGTRRD